MKITFKSLMLFLFLFGNIKYSQAQISCGSDLINHNLLKNDSVCSQNIKTQLDNWKEYKESPSTDGITYNKQGVLYEIPVVFHIIHTGESIGNPKNPSDSSIKVLLKYLNDVFAASYASKPDTNNGGVYVPIRFVLANKNPNCDSSSGINRVDGSVVSGYKSSGIDIDNGIIAGDVTMKNLSRWNPVFYMNIWIVTKINGGGLTGTGIAGYATYPGTNAEYDGIVLVYDQLYWALDHEVGHYLGLRHTFEGANNSTSCPKNNNCNTDGDLVCDTDPHPLITNCPTGTNTCSNKSYIPIIYNIMGYSSCPNRFTNGQKERMIFMLMNYRPKLLNSLVLEKIEPNKYFTDFPKNTCTPAVLQSTNNGYDVGPRSVLLADLKYYSLGYINDGKKVYIDNTSYNCLEKTSPIIANLYPDEIFQINVTTGFNIENVVAWIDFNDDGDFQNAEMILSNNGTKSFETHSANFKVPNNFVSCKSLRMRVAADYYLASTPTACNGYLLYGQTEDFIVRISEKPKPIINLISDRDSNKCNIPKDIIFETNIENKGNNITYQWFQNDSLVSTDSMFKGVFLKENDTIYCKIKSENTCNLKFDTSISNSIILDVSPIPNASIAIQSDYTKPVCFGTELNFDASIIEGGNKQSYQWYQNQNKIGNDSNLFSSNLINDKDSIWCQLIRTNKCNELDTFKSNKITPQILALNSPPIISISASPSTYIKPNDLVYFVIFDSNSGSAATYKWLKNGNIILGETNKVYNTNILNNGDIINAIVKSSLSCTTIDTAFSNNLMIEINTSGILKENAFGNIQLYPNPNKGIFTIKGNLLKSGSLKIEITNILGQQVYNGILKENNQQVKEDIILSDELPNGIYLLKLMDEKSSQTIKFYIEK